MLTMCTSTTCTLLGSHSVRYQFYANETKIFMSFDSSCCKQCHHSPFCEISRSCQKNPKIGQECTKQFQVTEMEKGSDVNMKSVLTIKFIRKNAELGTWKEKVGA